MLSRLTVPALLLSILFIPIMPTTATAQTPLTSEEVISGLSNPVFAVSPPGDYERFFIVEQSGTIQIMDITTRTLNAQPFLDVSSSITFGGEQGLLGLAFHPDYESNGYFYTYYTNTSGDNEVNRFEVSGTNPDSADENTETEILYLAHPSQLNHNGGWIGFGPDDYLYIAVGDGGGGGDPFENGQDITTLLGAMLRIDVDGGSPYGIPPSNPFVGETGADEVFYWGLRNPWRNSFDRATGEIYIADVGQGDWEEINWRPAADSGNINFGWDLKEGTHCYEPSTNCDPGGITTDPIYEYSHDDGCSITGGYVYRGCTIPDLQGTYFFADYCAGDVWSFRFDGVDTSEFQSRTSELGLTSFGITSFGEDNFGELYLLYAGGSIRKIVPQDGITDCNNNFVHDSCEVAVGLATDNNGNFIPDECESDYVCGDADGNDQVAINDAVFIINFIFGGGPAPNPLAAADADCNGQISITDAVYIINYIFGGGPAPCASCA